MADNPSSVKCPRDFYKLGGEFWTEVPWPPSPKVQTPDGRYWRLVRFSQLSDEEANSMDFVSRGAEYAEVEQEGPGATADNDVALLLPLGFEWHEEEQDWLLPYQCRCPKYNSDRR
jgi:hypothetical protein